MKFNEHLSSHLTPEWRTQYIKYSMLKEFLYKCVRDEGEADNSDEERRYFDACDLNFFPLCCKELIKINNFFSEKLAEAIRKFDNLRQELSHYQSLINYRQHLKKGDAIVEEIFLDDEDEEAQVKNQNRSNGQKRPTIKGHLLPVKKYRTLHDLKLGFSEFYLSLILLQNYQALNFTGFRKILKKHDKLFNSSTGLSWRLESVEGSVFHTNNEVNDLILQVEGTYIKDLEAGDRQKAMKRLRVPPLIEKQDSWTTFRLGLFLGVFLVQLAAIGLTILLSYDRLPKVCGPANRIFRSTFLVILFIFLIGVNVHCWRTSGVNHVLIFEIDPRNHLTPNQLMEKACRLLVLWGCCVLYFVYAPLINAPSYVGPFVIVTSLVLYLLNPLPLFNYKSRIWFRNIMIKIFLTPLHSVRFADFWLADQLNSLSFVFVDIGYFICFFGFNVNWSKGFRTSADVGMVNDDYVFNSALMLNSSYVSPINNGVCNSLWYGFNPLLRSLPALFRFGQCFRRYYDQFCKTKSKNLFPHVINAGKYLSSIIVVVVSVFYSQHIDSQIALSIFLMACIVNSVYTCSWDLLMDWGLFDRNAQEDRLLRDELVYRYKTYYFLAIVENVLGRLLWIVLVVTQRLEYSQREIVVFVVMSLEVFRRFVWNFFRLENEHLNNCGEFRAVRDISIAPIKLVPPANERINYLKMRSISAIERYPIDHDSDSHSQDHIDAIDPQSTMKGRLYSILFNQRKIKKRYLRSIKRKGNCDNKNSKMVDKDPIIEA